MSGFRPVQLTSLDGRRVEVNADRFRVVLEHPANGITSIWLDRAGEGRKPDLEVRESKERISLICAYARMDAIMAGRDRARCLSYPPVGYQREVPPPPPRQQQQQQPQRRRDLFD